MYESHFGLLRRPFLATPDPDCFVDCESIENALAGLRLCIEARKGFGVLSAPAGTGKTLLCRKLIDDLRNQFATVFLANSNFPAPGSLLQAVLYELGRPYLRMAEQELRLELQSAARQVRPDKQAVLLVVDEAHLLSDSLLEELRTVANVDVDGAPSIYVVMSGQLALEEKLARPGLEALNQRIGCQVTLEPLTRGESALYVTGRLQWAGADVCDVLQPDALELICHAADGSPRCLNQLCDHSLLLAYVSDERPVSEPTVREALDDLKQLPLHWNEPLPVVGRQGDASGDITGSFAGASKAGSEALPRTPAVEHLENDINETCEPEPALEVGETSSVEVGAPMPTGGVDSADQCEPAAAVLEFSTYDPGGEAIDVREYESQAVEPVATAGPVTVFRPLSIGDESVFEEEVVVDRYAMLDAGLPATGSIAAIAGEATRDAGVGTAGNAPGSLACGVDEVDAEMPPLGVAVGGLTAQSPEQLIDAIEPLVSQVLNEDCTWDAETVASVSESVVGAAVTDEDGAWSCIPIETPLVDAEPILVEELLPQATEDAAAKPEPYDVVQPEQASGPQRDGLTSVDPAADVPAEPKTKGRYAHLFSKLRRRQQSA